tara:strand:- start:999 stop:1613 length:615 start_codon:yes stop_codon:yes gene_type:complete
MADLIPLFSSPIITEFLNVDTSQLQKEKEIFREVKSHRVSTPLLSISEDIRILKKYPYLEEALLNTFQKIVRKIFNYDNEFTISTSWITKIKKGESSYIHMHKNSFYSGIYYYGNYDDKCGEIEFESPIEQFSDYDLMPSTYNTWTAHTHTVEPQTNLLIFFPSYLKHKIRQHNSWSTRYSLAFNIVPVGEYGNRDSTYNTDWF